MKSIKEIENLIQCKTGIAVVHNSLHYVLMFDSLQWQSKTCLIVFHRTFEVINCEFTMEQFILILNSLGLSYMHRPTEPGIKLDVVDLILSPEQKLEYTLQYFS